jgi:hypothetical protein
MQSLHKLIDAARRYQRDRVGNPVYVKFRKDTGESYYRSEILDARVDMEDDSLQSPGPYDAGYIQLEITWTRRYFWEAESWTSVSLTNGSGTSSSGVVVFNHDDADANHDNYVQIAAAGITGDLPAPPRLVLAGTVLGSPPVNRIFVTLNAFSTPASLAHVVEAAGGAAQAAATASGGSFRRIAPLAPVESGMHTITTEMNYLLGGWVRILGRWHTQPTSTQRFRLAVYDQSTTNMIWQGPVITPDTSSELQDLGIVQLPPLNAGLDSLSGSIHVLGLRGYDSASGDSDIDFFLIGVVDGYRVYTRMSTSAAVGLTTSNVLVDNMADKYLYAEASLDAGSRYMNYTASGQMLLYPGQVQRLYFAWEDASYNWAISDTITVQLHYRPRRLAL